MRLSHCYTLLDDNLSDYEKITLRETDLNAVPASLRNLSTEVRSLCGPCPKKYTELLRDVEALPSTETMKWLRDTQLNRLEEDEDDMMLSNPDNLSLVVAELYVRRLRE